MPIKMSYMMDHQESVRHPVRVNHTPGIITITDANTTVGYCRYDDAGEIEYVFVSSAHRRKGYAGMLLKIAEERLGTTLRFQPPISPLGERLVRLYHRQRQTDRSIHCPEPMQPPAPPRLP